jgi:hypothetical protein
MYQVSETGIIKGHKGKELKTKTGSVTINGKSEKINELVYKEYGGYKPELLEGEEFKHYDHRYSISNMGRVWNRYAGKNIKPIIKPSKHTVFYASRTERVHIAQEVAKLFIDNPESLQTTEHINGDRTDNRVINLRWKRPKEAKQKARPFLETGEEFRTIEGFNDYLVSNFGRVWSNKTNKILTPKVSNRGYYQIGMSREQKKYCVLLHRLVATAFINNPENKPQVNHIDRDRLNNNSNNLEWTTDQENKDHARCNRYRF